MDTAETKDEVAYAEMRFVFPDLIKSDYFQKYRRGYYSMRDKGYHNLPRNYLNLMKFINEISEYNKNHARSFSKRLMSAQKDWKNAEAIFSEIIVYRYYIPLVYEGLIKQIELNEAEGDVIIERLDGTKMYLEVFCVMPNFKMPENDGEVVVNDVKAHTQEEMASIRQKLLGKIKKQNQMTQKRENYAVIELNASVIADDFSVLSSLSGGYKIKIDKHNGEIIDGGYDWTGSIFNDKATKNIKCIIYFSLGNFESRKYIFNHNYVR